ncbi:MAG TPA: polysaccharide biosynthesis/export family protein [Bryocella sp.]|nr:polysaccharide biosynthesis/export family protein [Bryocella sp.]
MLALVVLLGLWTTAAAQNNAASSGGDSSNAAKPVLPSSDNGKDEAKATPLPASDTPASRVRGVPLPDGYVVGIGDVLDVNVWKESELSKAVGVRPDGMITLPLVGEIRAVGLTPDQLRDQITAALDKVLSDPVVTVAVVAVNSLSYNVMGNVGKPGYYPLTHPITILDAIALCGGFRDFAKQNKIYVLRADANGKQEKIFFNYKQVIRGQKMAQNILLQPNDTLVVP